MEAVLQVTYMGQQGDLPDPILYDLSDQQIRQIAEESIRSGTIVGISADASASLTDFVVDRFPERENLPNRIQVRPKTPFGF